MRWKMSMYLSLIVQIFFVSCNVPVTLRICGQFIKAILKWIKQLKMNQHEIDMEGMYVNVNCQIRVMLKYLQWTFRFGGICFVCNMRVAKWEMPKRTVCPITFPPPCAASDNLMFSLKSLIIQAYVFVCGVCIHSCVHGFGQLLFSQLLPLIAVSANISTRFQTLTNGSMFQVMLSALRCCYMAWTYTATFLLSVCLSVRPPAIANRVSLPYRVLILFGNLQHQGIGGMFVVCLHEYTNYTVVIMVAGCFLHYHQLFTCGPSLGRHAHMQRNLQNADLATGDRSPPYYPALCRTRDN